MFGTIRKHQSWLWAIIITVIIISFVWFFSPYTKMHDTGRGMVNLGSIYGRKITDQDFIQAQRETALHYFFMSGGRWPDEDARRQTGFDLERETFQWLLLVRKAEELGLHVSRETTAEVARNMLGGFKNAGVNSAQAFAQQVLEPRRMDFSDFERFVNHYIAIQEVVATAGVPGKLVTPQEAKTVYIRNNQEVSAEAAFFNGSNYLANVTVTPEWINSYYTNHLAEYRIPERLQVKYVVFGVSNYLSAAEAELAKTNLNDIITANMERLGTNYTRFGKTPEEAKTKIREEIIREKALLQARQRAAQFADELFSKEPVRAENLETLAKTNGLEVKVSMPFDVRGTPAGLDVGPDFAKAAFSRTPDDPFAQVLGRDGVYVITADRRIPSEVPGLENIRTRVVNEFKMSEATKLARTAGEKFSVTASNAVAQGKSFADACREANVTPVSLPPFSISSRSIPDLPDEVTPDEVKQAAFSTEPGKVSKFDQTMNGGLVVYVKAKLPVDEAKLNAELPKFMAQLRQGRQSEAFNQWFRKEADTGLRNTLWNRPRQQPPNMGAVPAEGKS